MAPLDQLDLIIHGWFQPSAANAESLFRLILAAAAGGITGFERESRGREAGFRTNILVCVGSALAMLVSYHVSMLDLDPHGKVSITSDPGRIAYGIMAGIGFLGSGAIVRTGTGIRGLTTAANIWCMAAVGLAYGLGMYVIATVCVLLIVLVLMLFYRLEYFFPKVYYRRLVIRKTWEPDCIALVRERFKSVPYCYLMALSFDRTADPSIADFTLRLRFLRPEADRKLEAELSGDPDYQLVAVADD